MGFFLFYRHIPNDINVYVITLCFRHRVYFKTTPPWPQASQSTSVDSNSFSGIFVIAGQMQM